MRAARSGLDRPLPHRALGGGALSAGLILAAGAGTRFGDRPKQLADLGGRPLLQWAIDAQCDVDPSLLDPIVVVLGARSAEVRAAVDPRRARIAVCEDWSSGLSASLRTGLAELRDARGPVVITLGDVPLVTAQLIARMAREPSPARAAFAGRPGHPVVLGDREIDALAGNVGDRGARAVLGGVRLVEVGGAVDDSDVDTAADLHTLRDRVQAQGDVTAAGPGS